MTSYTDYQQWAYDTLADIAEDIREARGCPFGAVREHARGYTHYAEARALLLAHQVEAALSEGYMRADRAEEIEERAAEAVRRAQAGEAIEWRVYDRTVGEVRHDLDGELTADEARDAGTEWMEDGDWERGTHEYEVECEVAPLVRGPDGEVDEDATEEARDAYSLDCSATIPAAGPPRTECGDEDSDHDWSDDYELVGGCKESPGVWGSGHGSVRQEHACRVCGLRRVTDYGATDYASGTQTTSVTYTEADEDVSADDASDYDAPA